MIAYATLSSIACIFSTPGHDIHPDEFTTVHGKKYDKCEVLKLDPNGVTFKHDKGIAKVEFRHMDKHLSDRYLYDPKASKEFVLKFNIPSKEAFKRHMILRRIGGHRYERAPYGLVRDRTTGLVGIATNPATPFYQSPYSNVSIADQLYSNHFSKHAQRVYGGATLKGSRNILGPRLFPYINNPYPRQIGTFGAGPSGGSLIPAARSGFSTGGAIAPGLGGGARR